MRGYIGYEFASMYSDFGSKITLIEISDYFLPKEEEIIKTLTVAIEMVQRGYKFENLDLYKSDATKFIVNHENKSLIPPFIVLDGLGETAARSIIEARKEKEFTSKIDLAKRTQINKTVLEKMEKLGITSKLASTDQLKLF